MPTTTLGVDRTATRDTEGALTPLLVEERDEETGGGIGAGSNGLGSADAVAGGERGEGGRGRAGGGGRRGRGEGGSEGGVDVSGEQTGDKQPVRG